MSPTKPTSDEMAAIVAAVELCWPRPGPAAPTDTSRPGRWRWSGRSWAAQTEMGAGRRPRSERRWR